MKKEYKTPTIKVITIQISHMLCESILNINKDEGISTEINEYSDYDGYGKDW